MTTPWVSDRSRHGFALAWACFFVSLLLPAFEDLSGWNCALTVLNCLFSFDPKGFWEWLYYSAFNVTNVVLLVLPVLAFTPFLGGCPRAARWLVGGCLLHTLSWFIWRLWNGGIGDIRIGYYLWLLAVGILLAACIVRARSNQITTQPGPPANASPSVAASNS